ncbi:hypothetical protein P7C73_g357, partial [Tremellales sp. Uapishka_1]
MSFHPDEDSRSVAVPSSSQSSSPYPLQLAHAYHQATRHGRDPVPGLKQPGRPFPTGGGGSGTHKQHIVMGPKYQAGRKIPHQGKSRQPFKNSSSRSAPVIGRSINENLGAADMLRAMMEDEEDHECSIAPSSIPSSTQSSPSPAANRPDLPAVTFRREFDQPSLHLRPISDRGVGDQTELWAAQSSHLLIGEAHPSQPKVDLSKGDSTGISASSSPLAKGRNLPMIPSQHLTLPGVGEGRTKNAYGRTLGGGQEVGAGVIGSFEDFDDGGCDLSMQRGATISEPLEVDYHPGLSPLSSRHPARIWNSRIHSFAADLQPIIRWEYEYIKVENEDPQQIAILTLALPPSHPCIAEHQYAFALPKNRWNPQYINAVRLLGGAKTWRGEARSLRVDAQNVTLAMAMQDNAMEWFTAPLMRSAGEVQEGAPESPRARPRIEETLSTLPTLVSRPRLTVERPIEAARLPSWHQAARSPQSTGTHEIGSSVRSHHQASDSEKQVFGENAWVDNSQTSSSPELGTNGQRYVKTRHSKVQQGSLSHQDMYHVLPDHAEKPLLRGTDEELKHAIPTTTVSQREPIKAVLSPRTSPDLNSRSATAGRPQVARQSRKTPSAVLVERMQHTIGECIADPVTFHRVMDRATGRYGCSLRVGTRDNNQLYETPIPFTSATPREAQDAVCQVALDMGVVGFMEWLAIDLQPFEEKEEEMFAFRAPSPVGNNVKQAYFLCKDVAGVEPQIGFGQDRWTGLYSATMTVPIDGFNYKCEVPAKFERKPDALAEVCRRALHTAFFEDVNDYARSGFATRELRDRSSSPNLPDNSFDVPLQKRTAFSQRGQRGRTSSKLIQRKTELSDYQGASMPFGAKRKQRSPSFSRLDCADVKRQRGGVYRGLDWVEELSSEVVSEQDIREDLLKCCNQDYVASTTFPSQDTD